MAANTGAELNRLNGKQGVSAPAKSILVINILLI